MSAALPTPADDGISELTDLLDSAPALSEAKPADPAIAPFPRRRDLRAQHAAASAAPSVGPSKSHKRRDARTGRRRSTSVQQPEIAAYVPTRRPRKRFKSLIVIVAVGGLMTTAGLPAYALGVHGELDPASASARLDVAAVTVSSEAALESSTRGKFTATSPGDLAQQRSDAAKAANYDAYMKSGAQAAGDDYPWFSELSNNQGGGLSPLNYFYRECVDFVAWRLNRDAGSTSAPFKYDWHNLTPLGGNASQWAANWKAHGWPTGTTPEVGSVAWFAGNHVAYVSVVNPDGTVLIEEYNHGNDHQYGQRTIPATDVALYLYAPPR